MSEQMARAMNPNFESRTDAGAGEEEVRVSRQDLAGAEVSARSAIRSLLYDLDGVSDALRAAKSAKGDAFYAALEKADAAMKDHVGGGYSGPTLQFSVRDLLGDMDMVQTVRKFLAEVDAGKTVYRDGDWVDA